MEFHGIERLAELVESIRITRRPHELGEAKSPLLLAADVPLLQQGRRKGRKQGIVHVRRSAGGASSYHRVKIPVIVAHGKEGERGGRR